MKLNNFIFVTYFLAAASLGLALPPKNATHPAVKSSATKSPQLLTDNVQIEQSLVNAAGAISSDCAGALTTVITSPEFLKCVPLTALVPLVPIVTDPTVLGGFLKDPSVYKSKLETPLTQFATEICKAPVCDDKAVAGAVQLLGEKCQKDLDNPFIQIIFAATVFYSPLQQTTCLKDKDQFCWDETLLGVTQLPKAPFEITKIPLVDSIAVADPSAICTNCPQQIVGFFITFIQNNKAAQAFLASKKLSLEEIEAIVAIKCGASFLKPKGK